jgi:hypothetical protein
MAKSASWKRKKKKWRSDSSGRLSSFGACIGASSSGFCGGAGGADNTLPPAGPPSGDSVADLRRDIDAWYAHAIAELDGMGRNGGAP